MVPLTKSGVYLVKAAFDKKSVTEKIAIF